VSGSWSIGKRVLAISTVVLLAPAALEAQLRTEITPFVASYYHLSHLSEGEVGPLAGNPFTIDQSNAFAFGGRVTLPVGARFAIEGEFAFALSGVRFTEQDIGTGVDGGVSQDGNIIHGSIRAVVSPRRSNLFLLAGPAIVKRGGDFWSDFDAGDITDFGGVVGFGFRANVTPRFRVNFIAESYLYSFDGGADESKFQADLLVSLGVPISIGGH
jgi:hypothetical protein